MHISKLVALLVRSRFLYCTGARWSWDQYLLFYPSRFLCCTSMGMLSCLPLVLLRNTFPIACSRGYPAFCSIIARWIRQLVSRWITQFLTLGPLQNRAHAIRSVGVSWAYSRIKHQYLRFARWSSHDLQVLRSECSGLIECKLCLEGDLMFPSLETCFVKSTTWDYVVLGLVPGTLHYNYIWCTVITLFILETHIKKTIVCTITISGSANSSKY